MSIVRSQVVGVGSYLPEKVLTNDDLAKTVDTSDAWIVKRTGIKQRHIAADGELTSDLGREAALRAMSAAQVKPYMRATSMRAETTSGKSLAQEHWGSVRQPGRTPGSQWGVVMGKGQVALTMHHIGLG